MMKKNTFKRATQLALVGILCAACAWNSNLQAAAQMEKAQNAQPVLKDETVYVTLDSQGNQQGIQVVNHLLVPEEGSYTDYGRYTAIKNMTDDTLPAQSGEQIVWNLPAMPEGFYYQGTLESGEIPWNFQINYWLDGKKVEPQQLAGATGKVEIEIVAQANERADAIYQERYMLQITVPVDMGKAEVVVAQGATQVVTGQSKQLAFTLLPGRSGTFRIELSVRDFAFDGISAAMMPADLSGYFDADEVKEGFSQLEDGAKELADGTQAFAQGMDQLAEGTSSLASGTGELDTGAKALQSGMKDYADGLSTYIEELEKLAQGAQQLKDGMAQAGDFSQLTEGFEGAVQAMGQLALTHEEKAQFQQLIMAAQQPGASQETLQAAQAAMAALKLDGAITQISGQLGSAAQGVGEAQAGLQTLIEKYGELSDGLAALPDGARELLGGFNELKGGQAQITSGVSELKDGAKTLNEAVSQLPDQAETLSDGQGQLYEGIKEAGEQIEEMLPQSDGEIAYTSFASAQGVAPQSVQFVVQSAAIRVEPQSAQEPDEPEAEENWFDRLLGLFRWN